MSDTSIHWHRHMRQMQAAQSAYDNRMPDEPDDRAERLSEHITDTPEELEDVLADLTTRELAQAMVTAYHVAYSRREWGQAERRQFAEAIDALVDDHARKVIADSVIY